jgi:BirA family biotin operon repressor/biotin-[acetyl-CoA-carboxylase] ligase
MPYSGKFDLAGVCARLPGRRVEWFESIDSTMIEAAKLAREGCASGTIVGADRQTAGVGRQGRVWHSEDGQGLYVSMTLRPALSQVRLPLAMLALGLAARNAIAATSGLIPDLRWPNDVLLDGKKCAGILASLDAGAIIAGIGINVTQSHFPPDISGLATSIRLSGGSAGREDLLVALAESVDECFERLDLQGQDAILADFAAASSYVRGRRVRVEQGNGTIEGVTCGLDPTGFLRLRQDNGTVTKILAGGVRPI